MRIGKLLLVFGLAWFLMGPGGTRCPAHPGNIATALAKVQPDGTFTLRLRFDLLAYILGTPPNHIADTPMNALLDGSPTELENRLTDARERFRQSLHVGSSGPEAIGSVTFPQASEILQSVKGVRTRLPVMASVTVVGHLPPGTQAISFQFDESLGSVVLTTEFPYQEPIAEPVDAGTMSDALPIPSAESVARAAAEFQAPSAPKLKASPLPAPVVVKPKAALPSSAPKPSATPGVAPTPFATPTPAPTATPAVGVSPTPYSTPLPAPVVISQEPVPAATPASPEPVENPSRWWTHFVQYVKMGYTHILPEGLDHMLFILGLFLLSRKMKPLLQQVTAFTLAHSCTLALSLYGVVHLPSSIVEPIIAASIAFVAIENLFTTEMKTWRLAVVFGFGLIHGLGFAAALQELGLKQENMLNALLGFNVGVELGQLSVVLAAFFLVGRFRNRPNYRKFVVIPGSLAIAATALFWTFQRIL